MKLNPKRIKILIGIIFILCFGAFLDFYMPVESKNTESFDTYYSESLDSIAGGIDKYHEMNGKLPGILFGGDAKGWHVSNRYQIDPLIESGVIDSYPNLRHQSINAKKKFVLMNMFCRENRLLNGRNCDKMCDVQWLDLSQLKNANHENKAVDYLEGNFFYQKFSDNPPIYSLLIIDEYDESKIRNSIDILGDSIKNSLSRDEINRISSELQLDGVKVGIIRFINPDGSVDEIRLGRGENK